MPALQASSPDEHQPRQEEQRLPLPCTPPPPLPLPPSMCFTRADGIAVQCDPGLANHILCPLSPRSASERTEDTQRSPCAWLN